MADRTRTQEHATRSDIQSNQTQVWIASGLNLLAGLWLIISPFIIDYVNSAAAWNTIIVGIAVAAMAAIRVFGAYRTTWLSWANVVLGAWLIISPWIFGINTSAAGWNMLILGVIVAALGAWSALATRNTVGS